MPRLKAYLPAVLLGLTAAFAASPTAAKPPKLHNTIQRPLDVSGMAGKWRLATDGRGHYLMYLSWTDTRHLPRGYNRDFTVLYSPDGKRFYAQKIRHSRQGKGRWTLKFRDPRHPENGRRGWHSYIKTEDGGQTLTVRCDDRSTRFGEIPDDETTKRLGAKSARFFEPFWNRSIHSLGRDDHGVYYLVDNVTAPPYGRDYRVYRGRRGKMQLLPLKDVAHDTHGQVFSTDDGSLRMIITRGSPTTAEWISGDKRRKLVVVNTWLNQRMAYRELGPYVGQRLGTPCDDL